MALEGLQPVVAVQCQQRSGESWWLCDPGALVTLARHVAHAYHCGIRAAEYEQHVLPCWGMEELIHLS